MWRNCADNTPATDFVDELRLVLHTYCRDAYAKYISGNQGAIKSTLVVTREP